MSTPRDQLLKAMEQRAGVYENSFEPGFKGPGYYMNQMRGTNPPLRGEPEEDGTNGRFTFKGLFSTLKNPAQLAQGLIVGGVSGAVLDPLEALLSLPILNITKADEFLSRTQQGLQTSYEEMAMRAGLTPDEIASAYATGNFVGFMAPVFAAMGVANVALRGKQVWQGVRGIGQLARTQGSIAAVKEAAKVTGRYTVSGDFMTEVLAGGIYGAALRKPDEGDRRLNNALEEAAFFGVGRAMMSGVMWTGKFFQLNRAATIAEKRGVGKALEKLKQLRPSDELKVLDEIGDEAINAMNAGELIIASPRAMKALEGDSNLQALIYAAQDATVARGNAAGVFNYIEVAGKEVSNEIKRLNTIFPNYAFDVVDNPLFGKQIYFSSLNKPLTEAQLKEIAEQGLFKGQHVRFNNGREGVVVNWQKPKPGASPKRKAEHRFRVMTKSGQMLGGVPHTKIQPALGRGGEGFQFDSAIESMFKRFKDFVETGDTQLVNGQISLTVAQVQAAARKGVLKIDDAARRAGATPGTVHHPESLGLIHSLTPESAQLYQEAIEEIPRLKAQIAELQEQLAKAPNDEALIAQFQDLQEQLIGRQNTVGELRVGLGAGVEEIIAREGMSMDFHILDNWTDMPLGQKFDAFMETLDPALRGKLDYDAMKGGMINRYLDDALELIDPEDADLLRSLILEQFEQGVGDTLEDMAIAKGFHLYQNPQGDKFVLRDIMTGREFAASSREAVESALYRIVRESPDLVLNEVPLPSLGITPRHSGRSTDGLFTAGIDDINLGEFQRQFAPSFFAPFTNFLRKVEEKTNLPIFRAFKNIDVAITEARQNYIPIKEHIRESAKIAKKNGVGHERVEMFFSRLGRDHSREALDRLSLNEIKAYAKAQGFNDKEIEVFGQLIDFLDLLTPELNKHVEGTTARAFLPEYYARLRPDTEALGVVQDSRVFSQFFDEDDRLLRYIQERRHQGRVARVEQDPFTVLDSFAQSLYMDDKATALLDDFLDLAHLRVKDLPVEQRAVIFEAAKKTGREITGDDFYLHEGARKLATTWYDSIKYGNKSKYEGTVQLLNSFFTKIGVQVDSSVVDEFVRLSSSLMYGATLAFRPIQIVTNQFQMTAMGMPRLGTKHMIPALRRAMSMDGFIDAKANNIIRDHAGIRLNEAAFLDDLVEFGLTKTNDSMVGSALEGVIRWGLKAGRWTEDKVISNFGMVPFSSIDDFNRVYAFNWQKMSVQEKVEKYVAKYGRAAFMTDDAIKAKFNKEALAFYRPVEQSMFWEQLTRFGDESAFNFLGREFSDQTNFIYGRSLTPGYMQHGYGRLFGMFGTFPMWTLDHMRRLGRPSESGSLKATMGAVARYTAFWGAMANIGHQYGIKTDRYMVHNSYQWTGGPAADAVIDVKTAIEGDGMAVPAALSRIALNYGKLQVPGQVFFFNELPKALQQSGAGTGKFGMENINPYYLTVALMMGRPEWPWLYEYTAKSEPLKFSDPVQLPIGNPKMIKEATNPAITEQQVELSKILDYPGVPSTRIPR